MEEGAEDGRVFEGVMDASRGARREFEAKSLEEACLCALPLIVSEAVEEEEEEEEDEEKGGGGDDEGETGGERSFSFC